jgi:putative hemolysin
VNDWVLWVGFAGLLGLTLFSVLNLSLRTPSRSRNAEEFDRRGRGHLFEGFVARRPQYLLATAALRSASVFVLFVTVLYQFESGETRSGFNRIIGACTVAGTLLLIFGVAIPYAWAKYSSEGLVVFFLPLLVMLRVVFLPVIKFLELFDPVIRRLAGVPLPDAKSAADELEQEILDVVSEGELHGAVDEEEKEMIESVIELGDTRVVEIITPRTEIVALPVDADLATVLEAIRSQGHSRIPVYEGTIDTILGVLYAKDLLGRAEDAPFQLSSLMRKALFIPESKLVRDLLRELQKQKVHIAIVLDEYGGTSGLVTIEDILEELVGEIGDEYETTAPATFKRIDETTFEVDAGMRIYDLNDQLNVMLPDDRDYETLGGFVFSTMGKIPKVGERCQFNNIGIQVLAAEPQRITRLLVKVAPTEEPKETAT